MVEIEYDNANPFDGISPTPFISRELRPINEIERKGLIDSLTLEGTITGECNGDFSDNFGKFNLLLDRLSENFRRFRIIDDGQTILDAPCAIIRSVNIPENKWFGLIPYTIQLDLYNSGFFSGAFGILECTNSFEFEENDDCSVSLTHTIRAKSINTNIQAISNARNFAASLTGWSSQVLPAFIASPQHLILQSVVEKSDRINATHEIVENYLYDPTNLLSGSGIFKYELNLETNDNIVSVNLDGQLIGGRNVNISTLRTSFGNVDLYDLANDYYQDYFSGSLGTNPNVFSVTENPLANTIDFTVLYDTSTESGGPYLIDETIITRDELSSEVCLEFQGTIKTNKPCSTTNWQDVINFYNNYDLQTKINSLWAEYGSGVMDVNPRSHTYGENEVGREITFSVEYCNTRGFPNVDCLEEFNYKLSFSPPVTQYAVNPILDGDSLYCIQNLGFKRRANYSINGSARVKNCCSMQQGINILKTQLNQISAEYFKGARKVLLSQSIVEGEDRVVSFDVSWSAEGTDILPNYLK